MPNQFNPINISDFPADLCTNCFGFALGDVQSLKGLFESRKYNLDGNLTVAEAFKEKLTDLGYAKMPRQISTVEEAQPNEYVLMVVATDTCLVPNFFDKPDVCWNAHIVRRELDGTWVHKPGWKEQPCEVKTEDWESVIFDEFGHEYVLFAVA